MKEKPYTETARFKRLAKEYLNNDARLAKIRGLAVSKTETKNDSGG